MPSSGTYNFSVNRDQLVRLALLNIGVIDEIETPTPQQTTDVVMFLNMLVKQWMGTKDFSLGLKVWTQRHGFLLLSQLKYQYALNPTSPWWTNNLISTTLTAVVSSGSVLPLAWVQGMSAGDNIGVVLDAGYIYWSTIAIGGISGNNVTINGTLPSQSSVNSVVYNTGATLAQQPLEIRTAFLRDANNSDVLLKLMTSDEYDLLPNKADPVNLADPTAVYYEWMLAQGNLYLDCGGAQDLTKYICITYLEEIQDFNNPADTPEYPQEWYLPLALGTSKLCCPMFRKSWTAEQENNYTMALAIAQKKGPTRETTYFQPGAD